MAKGKNIQPETPTTLEGALELIKNQQETISELEKLVNEQAQAIEKLERKSPGVQKPTVIIGKTEYVVVSGTRHDGKNLTPAEVAENKELCEKLLAIEGQTILVKEEE